MNNNDVRQFVESNPKLVKAKDSIAFPKLKVLKYNNRVFYDSLWNEFLENCRGTVVDENYNVVSRPFTKIYNFRVENESPQLDDDTEVIAYRKVNGFLCNVTTYDGQLLVSTTGSTDSEYVDMAKKMMQLHMPLDEWFAVLSTRDYEGHTFMFECVHPNDPHIIPETAGIHLLGFRKNSWDSLTLGYQFSEVNKDIATQLKCHYVEHISTTVGELVAMSKQVKHEGFVAYTSDNVSFKIKSPYYLVQKWLARNPKIDKILDLKNDIKKNIDEEYYNLVDYIRSVSNVYVAMSEQERLSLIRDYFSKSSCEIAPTIV